MDSRHRVLIIQLPIFSAVYSDREIVEKFQILVYHLSDTFRCDRICLFHHDEIPSVLLFPNPKLSSFELKLDHYTTIRCLYYI